VVVEVISNAHGALAATLALLRDTSANIDDAYAAAVSDSSETTFLVLGVNDAPDAASASGL